MAIDYGRMDITISTHYRPAALARVLQGWSETAPTYHELRVILNHPQGMNGIQLPARGSVVPSGRPPEHVGCMAKTWNLAMLWAFRNPDVDWLLCSMDDAVVLPGWPDVLATRDADLYLAPAGDLVFLMNRRAFREVGWFDERFTVMGYQEWDWEARAYRALGPDRVSIQDDHGWVVNPIGLSRYWQHDGGGAAPTSRDMSHQYRNRDWFAQKWGCATPDFWTGAVDGPGPSVPEIDWYPWMNRGVV